MPSCPRPSVAVGRPPPTILLHSTRDRGLRRSTPLQPGVSTGSGATGAKCGEMWLTVEQSGVQWCKVEDGASQVEGPDVRGLLHPEAGREEPALPLRQVQGPARGGTRGDEGSGLLPQRLPDRGFRRDD